MKRGGRHYYAGHRVVSERGVGDGILHRNTRPTSSAYFDRENMRHLLEVQENLVRDLDSPVSEDNPLYIVVEAPQPIVPKEVAVDTAVLLNAIIALKNGDPSKVEELESPINLEVENKEIPDGPKGDAV